jgi:peptidoglycan/LPS O-acetylase OafA/YrhL
MKASQNRIEVIDGLKAIAMQFIVLHHLAAYGPLADAVQVLFPDPIRWLYNHGRMAVQIFLVIGGYLAARVLSPQGERFSGGLIPTIANRYLRLALPYTVALLFAVACAAFARRWIDDGEFISAAPVTKQWLAHLLLLQDVFGYESLSTGVWYVAIDFQLFVLLAALLWLSKATGRSAPIVGAVSVLAMSVASIYWFNRNDDLDVWAVYFFGAYGLGAITYWARQGGRNIELCQRLLWLAAAIALIVDFRWRLLLALSTALLLHFANGRLFLLQARLPVSVKTLGKISYSQFLVHFPLYMLISALFVKYELLVDPWAGVFGMVLTWLLSIAAALLLHRWIEKPVGRIRISWAV